MKIAVISDTHVGQKIDAFPQDYRKILSKLDAIIHCGDYANIDALKILRGMANFHGVCGNMDSADVRAIMPENLNISPGGMRIGVIHGWGIPENLSQRVVALFRETYPEDKFDIILFGHAHTPSVETIDDILVINPGAFSGNKDLPYGSWGILTIENGKCNWELQKTSPQDF